MPQQITVRVELGPYAILGRDVDWVEVQQAVGDHAVCTLTFDRDPRAATPLAQVQLADLADASVRVVFLDAEVGAAGEGGCLAFEGRVREARVAHQPAGGGRFTVTAVSESQTLAAHADRRYLPQQTVPALVAAMGASVAGSVPAGEPRDYVQKGESDWAFLARLAAGEGLQLRPVWPRSPDDGPPPEPAEVGRGFGDVTHALTWGRDLLAFESLLRPTNPGVTGAFYDPATKHDHRFRGVRQKAAWLGGAQPVVAAAERVSTQDSGGGDPGHIEVGGPGGVRARTQEEFRTRLERASAARAGAAVEASGMSTQPGLRAGDRVTVSDGNAAGEPDATGGERGGSEGEDGAGGGGPSGLSPWGADVGAAERGGTYGLIRVTHRWTGSQYENEFAATPWADYHPAPALVERQLARSAVDDGDAGGTHALPGAAGSTGGLMLGVVVDNADPKGRGRVKVRFGWMDEGEQTHWVRVAGLGGGNGRGVGVLPSAGDEVVVAAVAGDPEHPVVLGALWNGVDRAGHAPGRQHWVTPAGNTLAFSEGKAGADEEKVELYSKTGACMVQLAAKGPTGVPTVTVHSEGDLALEAPKGELRITAKSMATFVETDAKREVKGAVHDKVTGPVTLATEARLAFKGGPEVVLLSGGALRAHATGTHTLTGQLVTLNPDGAQPPEVTAEAPEKKPSGWGARPVPGAGPGRSTQDPRTPTRKELAQKAQRAEMSAAPAVADPAAATTAAAGATPAAPPGPTPLANPTPCGGQGLGASGMASAFASGVKRLQQQWGTLNPNQRADRFGALVNGPLTASGAPPVRVAAQALAPNYNGLMLSDRWTLAVNERFFQGATLSDAQAGVLADTAYHEARHAQQWFMMGQMRAGDGATAEMIRREINVPLGVAQAATGSPIAPAVRPVQQARAVRDATATPTPATPAAPTPARQCAEAMHGSVFGAGAAHRNQTLRELSASSSAVAAAQQQVTALTQAGASPTALAQAQQAFAAAVARNQAIYPVYRALPEEADAWATGSLVRQFWP